MENPSPEVHTGGPRGAATGPELSMEHVLTIGREGEEDYEFFRVVTVRGLRDSRILVVDGMSQELRFFSTDGELESVIGGRGEGPGEFMGILWVEHAGGDTLLVYDSRARRLTYVIAPPGARPSPVRTVPLRPPPAGPPPQGTLVAIPGNVLGHLDGDRFLLMDVAFLVSGGGSGFRRWPVTLLITDAGQESVDTLGTMPAIDAYETGSGQPPGFQSVPLARRLSEATHGDEIYVTDGSAFQVDVFRADGTHLRSIRERQMPKPVGEVEKEAYVASLPEGSRTDASDLPFLENLPAFAELLVDDEGGVWAREYTVGDGSPQRWHVFDRGGTLRGVLACPDGFVLENVTGGRLYGVRKDELDIETVEIYRLTTVGPGGA